MHLQTCFNVEIAYYTHLVPLFVAMFISIYLLIKTKGALLSKIFFTFVLSFSIWLIFDLIAWTPASYNVISWGWSLFDYFNIVFFLYGLYFFSVLIFKKDIEWQWKLLGFALTLLPLYIIFSGNSITLFDQQVCEAWNNDLLTQYKNYVEFFVIVSIVFFTIWNTLRRKDAQSRGQVAVIGGSLFLFFVTFAGTDYLSVQTNIYEIGLYGLFVMPIFLGLIVYAIVRYNAFTVRVITAQALVITLIVLVGSQFFFIVNNTNRVLNAVTFLLAVLFGNYLIKGVKRDIETGKKIKRYADELQSSNHSLEQANIRLKELDQQKTEFISLATHQIRGPLGAIKGHASLALEGDYGQINDGARKAFDTIFNSAQSLVVIVNDYLNVSRIEQGKMKYDFSTFDLKNLVKETINEFTSVISDKSLTLDFNCDQNSSYNVNADMGKIKQVISNLIDNSIKYTPKGHVRITLEKKDGQILLSVKDTGVGIKPEVIPNLFEKFSRAPDANKVNILGTGLGLFVAKSFIEAHGGKIWAESKGEGFGAEFYIQLNEKI